ncbi:MAG: transcription-repair coupling factor, partial [Chloroflexota bacterium]
PAYQSVRQSILTSNEAVSLTVPESAASYFIAALQSDLRTPLLFIVPDPERAASFTDELESWAPPGTGVMRIPEPDFPYVGPSEVTSQAALERARLASQLALGREPLPDVILVSSVLATLGTLPPPERLAAAMIQISRSQSLSPEQLLDRLVAMGYQRVQFVGRPGEFSRRGGIVDIFSPTLDHPVRMEFFGDEVDTIRPFDTASQRSFDLVETASISPVSTTGGTYSIVDYLPASTTVVLDDPSALRVRGARLRAEITEYMDTADAAVSATDHLYWEDIESRLSGRPRIGLLAWMEGEGDAQSFFAPALSRAGRLDQFIRETADNPSTRERTVLISQQSHRLSELFEQHGRPVPSIDDMDETPPPGSLSIVHGSLPHGWTIPGELRVLTDAELFGFVKRARRQTRGEHGREPFVLSYRPGDLVVHVDHGIGRFAGLTTLETGGIQHEYLEITYHGGDTLYVPTDQIRRVSRYVGGGEHAPHLSRLGSSEWESTKQRARQSTRALAQELVSLYARRQIARGHAFSRDTFWQQELEASFPYIETPDQLEVIDAVKSDMEGERPMDRLICGDVGYGKTEIALRAAFKAVMEGKQVAILTPTTVLAQQHYTTFSERLGAFPVTTAVLSRFSTQAEEREILNGLATGRIDILIGTHRLLQHDIVFKDLGLLIIDEEQRFGVMQKEALRSLKAGLDTLTLSATPIPRTLHMALTGIRDLSTMETPPEERLAVRTHVGPYDQTLVRQAILRELERNGQVFFIHNRIESIQAVVQLLRDLVPEARFGCAHGRMAEDDLERTMTEFALGNVDVLVATTIVQLGLDMPNANTLIVNQAERLGLTQLYQLRGRVGRGRNQAHAYFFHTRNKELSPQARRRLRTIFEANELGAGLEIALRDLEIRGAGSLLGTRQSGHIAAVGFELYCSMLAEEVERIKPDVVTPEAVTMREEAATLDLPVSAFIPDTYVENPATRIILYRRLTDAATPSDIDAVSEELRDRFGPLPSPLKDLIYVARIRVLATRTGVTSITRQGSELVLVPKKMSDLATHLNLGPAVKAGPTQVRIDTRKTGGKWRALLEALLTKQKGDAETPPMNRSNR